MTFVDIFVKLLNMSFAGTVAAVMIMWLRFLYHVLPKKYLCILWCVVLIRLLCPFTFPELGIGRPIQEPIPSNIMEVSEPYIASEIEVIDHAVNHVLEQRFIPEAGASVNPMQIAMTVGTYVWIAGMIGMLIFTTWKLFRFCMIVREGIPDKKLEKRVFRCGVSTPVLTGVIKPRIYLPFSLTEPQLSHVLIHENMHIKRKDHIVKLLFYIALIVHWFNPFVWISYRLLERDMEMACDEAVLERLGTDEKKNYCESLLNLADSKNHFVGNPVAFGESDVKARIKNVLNYRKPHFGISAIAIIILIYAALSCLTGPKESNIEMNDVEYPLTKEVVDEAFAQVDLPGPVGGGGGLDHLLQQHISLRQVRQDHVVVVPKVGEGRPVEDHLHVAQSLDAGAKLHAEHGGVIIQGLHLLIGIAAALIAEEGTARDLVGVLGVHHAQVQAHQCHLPDEETHGIGIDHAVSGAVEHGTGRPEIGLLPDVTGCQRHGDQAQGPEKLHIRAPGQLHGLAVADHGDALAPAAADLGAAVADIKLKIVRQLRQSGAPAARHFAGDMNIQFHSQYSFFHKGVRRRTHLSSIIHQTLEIWKSKRILFRKIGDLAIPASSSLCIAPYNFQLCLCISEQLHQRGDFFAL